MDAGPSVNPGRLNVPTQRPSACCPSNILTGACSRCSRATELGDVWNTCGLCAAGGPHPGAALVTGPSTIQLYPTANCTACRVPFRVPSYCQTAQALCPPCQALHIAIVKPNPRDSTVPRANPYPVVSPQIARTPRALASTLAFTYPDLPAPTPTSASVGGRVYTSVNRREYALRVCMRFGCGARLPAHVLGDMCMTCAGAGFIRPPPAVVQKRVPRRATERTCPPPRDSLGPVRTSLLQEAGHGAKITAEEKAVEDELEVELVYPDDTPVATQYISITPESKREEPKLVVDEDVELELVYPEDAENATRTSSSKPRTKSPPPTTVRELFKDSLRTIPALQNPAPLADNSPPRRCRIPECNKALPAQSRMQRCIECAVGDWKRRKLAVEDTLDPSRGPSTSSLTTNRSTEREASSTLDEIPNVEDKGALPSPLPLPLPPSSPSKGSSNEATGDRDVSSIPGWDSDLTELSDSDVESMSDSGPKPDLRLTSPHGVTGLRIRVPLLVTRLPPGSLLQKCGNKKCNIALPKDHRWKRCDPCRRAQIIRFENKQRRMMATETLKSPDLSHSRWRSLSPDMREGDVSLTPETSRLCSARQCQNRIPLPEVYRWKMCTSCRARARQQARRMRDALLETHASSQPEIVPRTPAYQNRRALLSSFDAQIKGFVGGQVMYFRTKLCDSGNRAEGEPRKPEHTSMIFMFVGEYSIVTDQKGDRERGSHDCDHSRWPDKPAELDAMHQEVSSIVLDLERILRAKFRAGEAFAIDKGGIIMRFTCSLELIAQLRPLAITVGSGPGSLVPSSSSDSETNASKGEDASSMAKRPPSPLAVPLVKTFSGELEVVVVPDESHHLFHGRRMVIRYHMVG